MIRGLKSEREGDGPIRRPGNVNTGETSELPNAIVVFRASEVVCSSGLTHVSHLFPFFSFFLILLPFSTFFFFLSLNFLSFHVLYVLFSQLFCFYLCFLYPFHLLFSSFLLFMFFFTDFLSCSYIHFICIFFVISYFYVSSL